MENLKLDDADDKIVKWFSQEHNCECQCNLYETKIHPMLRFLHSKEIKSCGWVSVKTNSQKWIEDDSKTFNVDIEIDNVKIKDINPVENEDTATICSVII